MKKVKVFVSGLLISSLLLTVSGCGSQPTENKGNNTTSKSDETQISIGTASAGGVFYPLGVGMAKVIQDNIPGTNATAEETGGGRENATLLAQQKIEMGMITTFTAQQAIKGEAPFKQPVDMKLGWKLFDDTIVFIVLDSSPIKKIEDMKGKKISLGTAGSEANTIGIEILKAYGIGEKDFSPVFQGWSEAADTLADGQIDVITVMGGTPIPAVNSLAVTKNIRLIPVDLKYLEALTSKGIFPLEIPANSYKGQTEPVMVADPYAYLWFSSDLSEDTVYKITKAIFSNIDYLKTVHPIAGKMQLPSSKDTWGEVHPGVKKYVQEIGKW